MDECGVVTEETTRRINKAIELEEVSPSSILLVSGWGYKMGVSKSLAYAMYSYVLEARPDIANRTRCQSHSRDTVGDAVFARLLLEATPDHYRRSLRVVTSSYHEFRAAKIFNFVFHGLCSVELHSCQWETTPSTLEKESLSTRAFYNSFRGVSPGDIETIFDRLAKEHPYYNGKKYARIHPYSYYRNLKPDLS